jgi:hypothetical protein
VSDNDELAEELVCLDHLIKQLRLIRANATYDLEHAVREMDRVRRHLAEDKREERNGRS